MANHLIGDKIYCKKGISLNQNKITLTNVVVTDNKISCKNFGTFEVGEIR